MAFKRKMHRSGFPLFAAGLVLLSIGLAGCDKEEGTSDQTPPDHIVKAAKSQDKWRFGVTDTIAIEFDEAVDEKSLDLAFSDTSGRGWKLLNARKALIFGTRTLFETGHFPINTPFTLTLRGLRDRFGNGHNDIHEAFLPYPWVDRDFLDTTFNGYDTLFNGTAWMDGTPMTDTLLMEGRLDDNENFRDPDRFDYKVIRVKAPDTVDFFLKAARDMEIRVQIAGPFHPIGFDTTLDKYNFTTAPMTGRGTKAVYRDTLQTADQGRLAKTFRADLFDHEEVLDSFDAVGLYVVRLSVPEGKEGFYRLGFRIRKYQ